MTSRYLFILLLSLLPAVVRCEDASDEEVVSMNPFAVTSEEDRGYRATSTLAGTRIKTDLKDVGSAISVVTAEFLQDTSPAMPQVPVTVVKKADALVIQFALATTADKENARNTELNSYIESIDKAVRAVPGVRFEPREVYLASGDRKRSIIGKGGAITSFAHFVIFADLSADVRLYQRVKQVRDILAGLKIDSATTKLLDGPVGLYIRRPSQYRNEILAKVFEDLGTVKKGLGPDFEILVSGLSGGVRMRTCSETEVELWIDYSFAIRSIRELEAKKK
jgi:hypothetical protein